MSIMHFDSDELGNLVAALSEKSDTVFLALSEKLAIVSAANAKAYQSRYGETVHAYRAGEIRDKANDVGRFSDMKKALGTARLLDWNCSECDPKPTGYHEALTYILSAALGHCVSI